MFKIHEIKDSKYTLSKVEGTCFILRCNSCSNTMEVPNKTKYLSVTCEKCDNTWVWPEYSGYEFDVLAKKPQKEDYSTFEKILYFIICILVGVVVSIALGRSILSVIFLSIIPPICVVWMFLIKILKGLLGPVFYSKCLSKYRQMVCKHGIEGGITDGKCLICSHLLRTKNNILKESKELRTEELSRLTLAQLAEKQMRAELSPKEFEKLIANMFRARNFSVEETPYVADGGKDLILRKDGEKLLVECKQYSKNNPIGRPLLQQFLGAITEEKADGGYFVTTSRFTRGMDDYAAENNIILIDGNQIDDIFGKILSDSETYDIMCVECGVVNRIGIKAEKQFCSNGHELIHAIKEEDLNRKMRFDLMSKIVRNAKPTHSGTICPLCGRGLVIRKGKHNRFYGCLGFPDCRFTKGYAERNFR